MKSGFIFRNTLLNNFIINTHMVTGRLGAGAVAQLAECWFSMHGALGSIPEPHKPGVVAHAYNSSTEELEERLGL